MWLSGKKSSSMWHQKSQIAPKLINIWHQGHQNPSTIAQWHNHMWGYFFILLISSFTQFWMATATNFKARIVSKVFSWGYRSTGAKRSKRVRPHEASSTQGIALACTVRPGDLQQCTCAFVLHNWSARLYKSCVHYMLQCFLLHLTKLQSAHNCKEVQVDYLAHFSLQWIAFYNLRPLFGVPRIKTIWKAATGAPMIATSRMRKAVAKDDSKEWQYQWYVCPSICSGTWHVLHVTYIWRQARFTMKVKCWSCNVKCSNVCWTCCWCGKLLLQCSFNSLNSILNVQ